MENKKLTDYRKVLLLSLLKQEQLISDSLESFTAQKGTIMSLREQLKQSQTPTTPTRIKVQLLNLEVRELIHLLTG